MGRKFEIVEILEALSRFNVDFVVAGGVAVGLHGFIRATKDLDIVIDFSVNNIEKFAAALDYLGFKPKVPIKVTDIADPLKRKLWVEEKNAVVLSFQNPDDLFFQIDVFLRQDISALKTVDKNIKSFKIKIASLDELIRMKKEAARPQDLIDIKQLEEIKEQYYEDS